MKTPADRWDREEREALEPIESELAALRARHAGDPPLELLRAAHADALPPDLQAPVSAHLAESAWSRALLDGASDVDHALGAADADRLLARIKRSAEPRRSWSFSNLRVWAPLLTAAATAAIVVAVWSQWRTTAPAAPVVAPATPQTVIARNEPPRFEMPLDKPDVRLSVAALTWRGSGASSLVDDLAPALDAYRQSDYTRAALALEGVGRRYPVSIEAPFYRGISLLFLNDPAGAIVELKKAERMNDPAFASDVTWYLAVAEQRSGDITGARAHLDRLCRGTSAHAPAACDAMKRMDGAR
jgi:tetratricopeptide (TPR) repeat protein